MSVEANKEMITSTWEAFVKGDIKTAFANMSDEISWLIPGNLSNLSGLRRGKALSLSSPAMRPGLSQLDCKPKSAGSMATAIP
jgi:ketosteroid isomerase-like protein